MVGWMDGCMDGWLDGFFEHMYGISSTTYTYTCRHMGNCSSARLEWNHEDDYSCPMPLLWDMKAHEIANWDQNDPKRRFPKLMVVDKQNNPRLPYQGLEFTDHFNGQTTIWRCEQFHIDQYSIKVSWTFEGHAWPVTWRGEIFSETTSSGEIATHYTNTGKFQVNYCGAGLLQTQMQTQMSSQQAEDNKNAQQRMHEIMSSANPYNHPRLGAKLMTKEFARVNGTTTKGTVPTAAVATTVVPTAVATAVGTVIKDPTAGKMPVYGGMPLPEQENGNSFATVGTASLQTAPVSL